MRKYLISLMLILLCGMAFAVQVELNIAALGGQKVSLENHVILKPGQPMLAYYPVKILLPFGEDYSSATLSFSPRQELSSGLDLDFAKAQQPISGPEIFTPTPRDESIYGKNAFFPASDWEYLGTQYYRGYGIALFNVYPYKYNPVSKELVYSPKVSIDINTTFHLATAEKQAKMLRTDTSTISQLQTMVANPATQSSYANARQHYSHSPNRNIDLSIPRTMIVITDETRAPWFADYIAWRLSKGINTGLFLTSEIYANYTGVDNAAKVRNFILDAYTTWATTATPLEYVILGGDDEIVPERGVFGNVGDTVDNRMPSDLYFSNLDGDWNANNNTIFGELQDNVDYIPEVHIGRFPGETYVDFDNIFRKIRYYVDYNTFSNNMAIFYGENLNNNPLTWGGDYKDDVAVHLPTSYNYSTQYQRDGTYSPETVWNSINNGVNVMNHMGHANETYLMGQGNNTIEALRNTEYGFLYSQGCYPAAFDQRTSGDGECIGEHLLTASGGVFSFIGNTRYGWYMPGDINGASQYYDRQYFIGLYEQNHPELGRALSYSRQQNLNAALSDDVMRWCYMEVILFGDPSITVKLADPAMPLLTLDSYHFSDVEGDNDGNINPGETIRFYPVVSNAAGWATANNVCIRIESVPVGMSVVEACQPIPQILPGQSSPENTYITLLMPETMGYGTFTIKVAVEAYHPSTLLSIGVRNFEASFDITLFDNRFPWETVNAGKSAPIVADFDSNGALDIMYADVFGGINYIDNTGDDFSFFNAPSPQNINRSNAMGQIDGLAGNDLAFSSRSGNLYALTTSGEVIFDFQSGTSFLFTPVIADLNGDGMGEVIAGGLNGMLYVIKSNGTAYPGFPIQLSGTFQSELAVGDVNGDGSMEIVCGMSADNLQVVNSNGQLLPGFNHNLDSSLTGSPVILDNGYIAIASNSTLYLYDGAGNERFVKALDCPVAGGLICADLNRNGEMDIILVTVAGKLWAVNQNGLNLYGFPVDLGSNFSCPPLVADINGDNQYDILLHSYINSIYAIDSMGNSLEGFPFGTTYNGATPGTLVDFDDDGFFKLITGFSNGILMANLRRPASELAPWTVYRGNLNRQASFAATGYVANMDENAAPLADKLLPNYPNPFGPETTISFSLSQKGKASVEIYNVKGQRVRSLSEASLIDGLHSVQWDGKNDDGTQLPSGLYFYRLQTDSGTQTRKMLMLK